MQGDGFIPRAGGGEIAAREWKQRFYNRHNSKRGGVRQVMETVGAKEGDYVRLYLDTAASGEWTGTVEVYPTNFEQ